MSKCLYCQDEIPEGMMVCPTCMKNLTPSANCNVNNKLVDERFEQTIKEKLRMVNDNITACVGESEVWNLDDTFYSWLYERLKLYIKVASGIVDLNYHKFEYEGKSYTQLQMIDLMVERLEFYFSPEFDGLKRKHMDYVLEAAKIWAIVLPAMWV